MLEACQVRRMSVDDLPMVLAWRNHPSVRCFMFTQHEISLQEHAKWFMQVIQDQTKHLLIVEENLAPIGFVQFSHVELGGISDWGFYVRPDASKGTGRKLGSVALQYAFGQLQLHKVCGQAIATNQASIKFHECLGFKREAVLRDQKRINDQYHTLICYGLIAEEWRANKRGKDQ